MTSLSWLWTLVLWAALDTAPKPGEWGYRPPDQAVVSTTPPSLTWVHQAEAFRYTVQWSRRADFSEATLVDNLRWCAYTHSQPLPPGDYFWRYRYTTASGATSEWSQIRRFSVPQNARIFVQPSLDELRRRIPADHPRLFLRPEELPALQQWARAGGRERFQALLQEADRLAGADPTPEPSVSASSRDDETRQLWWPNRMQTLKACLEAEVLAFAYLITGQERYGKAARRWILHLASWDVEGATNFTLNCEAAKPLLHRLPRAYDWAYQALSEEDRTLVRRAMRRRAEDAWKSWEVKEGNGHLNQPFGSHANRTWHKLAECAIALFGEVPEAETWLDYAVHKFFAAYPVWSDDDGGWHEGLSYWAGYVSKVVWWVETASRALQIDSFQKPFFENAARYALYTAPPGTPDMGFGDLSSRQPQKSWTFVHYLARKLRQPTWAWWARQWGVEETPEEPVMAFLWSHLAEVEPEPPRDLPPSAVFRGTGVAVLNTNLQDGRENVQLRLKASPFGRQSHGHDPHNSITLNAYGDALLVNNVYRDWHGSPFHTRYTWTTRAQNALLVNGEGQKRPSPDPLGRIGAWDFQEGADYVAGEAAEAYEGKLRRFRRQVVFVKPDLIVLADEIEAAQPQSFQWMFHAQEPFELRPADQAFTLERERAALRVDFVAPSPVRLTQTTGYDPGPDLPYLRSRNSDGFPPQWHVEASLQDQAQSLFILTLLRVNRRGEPVDPLIQAKRSATSLRLEVPVGGSRIAELTFRLPGDPTSRVAGLESGDLVRIRRGSSEWRFRSAGF